MNLLSRLRLANRLAAGFGLVLLLLMSISAVALFNMRQMDERLHRIVEVGSVRIGMAQSMMNAINESMSQLYMVPVSVEPEDRKEQVEQLKKAVARYNKLRKDYAAAVGQVAKDSAMAKALNDLDTAQSGADAVTTSLLRSMESDSDPANIASNFLGLNPQRAQDDWIASGTKLIKLEQDANAGAYQEAKSGQAQARIVLIAVSAAALLIGLGAGFAILRSVTRPLKEAIGHAERIAGGDLSGTIVNHRTDEAGDLLRALSAMQDQLRSLVGAIHQSAESISTASAEIASGNQDLSQRTEEASSNLQQTASSMEQLTATVRQSAESAAQANQMVASAAGVAKKGGTVVRQVVETMGEINTSSKKISDIIGVIDGIAFQTNILALNAAVEAARAGEQGRGFAVVAGEVRSLAQRSAEAAKEIKALIGNSVDKVETGAKLVQDAGSTMNEIVASVQRVSDIIGEITAATAEQSGGLELINTSVTQLDQMTQQNSALVEESAAAAESLREQAQRLAATVAAFRLAEGGAGGEPASPVAHQAATEALMQRMRQPAEAEAAAPRAASAATAATATATATTAASGEWEDF